MALLTGPTGLRSQESSTSGHYQVWSTDGGLPAYLPYGGSYYTLLFFNSGGYGRMVGRVDWVLSISQVHAGHFNFDVSRYGGYITNIHNSNSTYANFSFFDDVNSNVNYHGIKWTNGNSSSWGNGTLNFCVQAWCPTSGSVVSGAHNTNSNYTSHSNSNAFLKRMI